MKIRLIKPPSIQKYHSTKEYALGLLYIGTILENEGHDIKAYDFVNSNFKYSIKRIQKIIQDQRPEMIGINCDSHNRYACFQIAKEIKRINSNIKVVVGGLHASYYYSQIMNKIQEIDFIIMGEAENTFLELANNIQDRKQINKIAGLVFRQNGEIIINKFNKRIENLDSLPIPKHEYYSDFIIKKKEASINSSRGCPGKCFFCSPMGYWGSFRARSAKKVFEEMKYILDRFPETKYIFFQEQCFTYDKNRIRELCLLLIKNKFKINWGCETRVDCVDDELLGLMNKAGCQNIAYGIESGSAKMLNVLNKGFTIKEAEDALNLAYKNKILTTVYLIVGSPGENAGTIKDTILFLKKNADKIFEIQLGIYYIYPWSPLFRSMKIKDDFWFENKRAPVNYFQNSIIHTLFQIERIRWTFIKRKGLLYLLNRLYLVFKNMKFNYYIGPFG